jgi:DNA-directed RNA polymerase subunit RPC12/RpoP
MAIDRNSSASEKSLECAACSSEITLFSKGKPDDVVVNVGGTIFSMGEDLYQGVICETCRKTWCLSCWVTMMLDDKDICPTCGVRLVPLTSSHLKS